MKNPVTLERLMIRAIRSFQAKMLEQGRLYAEVRNVVTQDGTGCANAGWKDATFKIDYVERGEYHVCYISVTQSVPDGYVYEEGEQTYGGEDK